jgi:surface polysaccharide O-acyltransferase-like enzyme
MKALATLNQNKTRYMNFELLRIISMIMVVALHYMQFGGALEQNTFEGVNWIFTWTIEALSIVAVNCYVLLSGYFLVKSKFKLKKLMQIWLQVLFYSLGIYIIFLGVGMVNFNIKDLIKSCLPVLFNQYWFATVYIAMYIFSPFLNTAIYALSKKQMRNLLIILFVMFSVWPTILPFGTSLDKTGGYSIIQFIFLYFIASYIRLHWDFNIKRRYFIGLYLLITLFVVISKVILTVIGFNYLSGMLYAYNSVTIVLSSVSLFLFFRSISIKNVIINKIISSISGLTFGVYLIHINPLINSILYKNILHTELFWNTKLFIPVSIGLILEVFIVCMLIDAIRKRIFMIIENSKIFNKLEEILGDLLLKLATNKYSKMTSKRTVPPAI